MQGKPPTYDGSLAAKEITAVKRGDSVNEKWPENLACCHKRFYLNACAAYDSFPFGTFWFLLSGHLRELKILLKFFRSSSLYYMGIVSPSVYACLLIVALHAFQVVAHMSRQVERKI